MAAWQSIDLRSDPYAPDHRADPGEVLDALGVILDLTRPPAWHAHAACREWPELSWFPERGEPVAAIRAICDTCPVREDCRAAALDQGELYGFWGGLSARERTHLRREAAGAV